MRILVFILFIPVFSFGQDLKFSFANNSNQFLNPANTGIRELSSFTLIHKSQWPSLGEGFESTLFTYEQGFGVLKNWGLYLASDRSREKTVAINDLGITWCYPLNITRQLRISIGYSAVLKHTYLNLNKLTWSNPINPRTRLVYTLQNSNAHSFGMDNHFGVMLYSKRLFLGFSTKHLLRINHFESPSYNIQTGYSTNLFRRKKNSNWGIFRAGISYTYQNDKHSIDVNSSLRVNRFILGGGIGNPRDYLVLLGLQFYSGLNISYVYSVTTNQFTNARGGNHEVMLRFDPFIRYCKNTFRRFRLSDL